MKLDSIIYENVKVEQLRNIVKQGFMNLSQTVSGEEWEDPRARQATIEFAEKNTF